MSNDSDLGLDEAFHDDRLTVFSGAVAQPIADCVAILCQQQIQSGQDGGGELENGYAISILMLSVLAFESAVGRVSHIRRQRGIERQDRDTTAYLRTVDPQFPQDLLDDLKDVYLVRDALAHAHMWTAAYTMGRAGAEVTSRARHAGYGDQKHRKHVDERTGRTKHLGLHVLPTDIGILEASRAMRTFAGSVQRLVTVKAIELPAVRRKVRYQGKCIEFWSLADELERSMS